MENTEDWKKEAAAVFDAPVTAAGELSLKKEEPTDDNLPNFSTDNKLHWMMDGVDASTKAAVAAFARDFEKWTATMLRLHAEAGVECMLTPEIIEHIWKLLSQCRSMFEVEALARYVMDDEIVPNEFQQVKDRAIELYRTIPLFDMANDKKKGMDF